MTQTAGQSSVSTDTEGPAGQCATGVNRRGTEPERWWTVGTLRGSGQHCPPLSLSAELCARRTHMQVLGLRPCGRRLIWKWGLRRQERLGWVALGWGRAGRALTQRPASLHRARTRRPRAEGHVTTGAGPGVARARGMPAAPGLLAAGVQSWGRTGACRFEPPGLGPLALAALGSGLPPQTPPRSGQSLSPSGAWPACRLSQGRGRDACSPGAAPCLGPPLPTQTAAWLSPVAGDAQVHLPRVPLPAGAGGPFIVHLAKTRGVTSGRCRPHVLRANHV